MDKQAIIKELKEMIPRTEKLCEEKNRDRRYDSAFKYGAICQEISNLVRNAGCGE